MESGRPRQVLLDHMTTLAILLEILQNVESCRLFRSAVTAGKLCESDTDTDTEANVMLIIQTMA